MVEEFGGQIRLVAAFFYLNPSILLITLLFFLVSIDASQLFYSKEVWLLRMRVFFGLGLETFWGRWISLLG
jgi:hypothetical protein